MVNLTIAAFGQNIDAVGIVIGLAVAVPLIFIIAEEVKKLFVGAEERREGRRRARDIAAMISPEDIHYTGK
jgi:hypothetical protein